MKPRGPADVQAALDGLGLGIQIRTFDESTATAPEAAAAIGCELGRKKVKLADAETTVEATGYEPGGVPPVGHVRPLPVLIDSTLGRYEVVYAAAGSPNAIFPIRFETLVGVTAGLVEDIVREDA
mgnify:CR=1 FL=1